MHRSRLLPLCIVALPLAVLWGPALVSDVSLALRDAAHFYHPLFEWCAAEWGAGRVPLWNPYENVGLPVLADATSSVFYPGKLLMALPVDFALRYKLYVVAHLALAAAGSYSLARAWDCSRPAAALAALAYAFSGPVYFQYSNVVFLVGAAWLPWSLVAAERIARRGSLAGTLALAVVLALIVLGGDPQNALHAVVLAGLWVVVRSRDLDAAPAALAAGPSGGFLTGASFTGCVAGASWTVASEVAGSTGGSAAAQGTPRPQALWGRQRAVRMAQVLAAAAGAAVLAAVQILPSSEATQLSERAAFNRPRTVYEAAYVAWTGKTQPADETPSQAIVRGLFGPPERGSHHELAFDFSIGPWRLAELFFPNVGGRMFPTHRRWFSLLPGEGRLWTPTLYLGLLPILLACRQARFFRGPAELRWLSWVALVFLMGSGGYYGLGWLVRELIPTHGEQQWPLGPQVGSLYWLWVTLVPSYIYFRYPAKLLSVAALGISQLAARGWDAEIPPAHLPLVRLLKIWGTLCTAVALMVWLIGPALFARVGRGDASLGPFDRLGAYHDLLLAFAQPAAVALAAAWLLQRCRLATDHPLATPDAAAALLLGLVAGDIVCAHRGLVATAPAELWRGRSPIAVAIDRDRHSLTGPPAAATATTIGDDARPKAASNQSSSSKESPLITVDTQSLETPASVPVPSALPPSPPRYWRGSLAGWRPEAFRRRGSAYRQAEIVAWEAATLFPKYHLAQRLSLVESYGSIKLVDQESFFFIAKQFGPPQPDGSTLPQPTALRLLGTEYLVLPARYEPAFARRVAPAPHKIADRAASGVSSAASGSSLSPALAGQGGAGEDAWPADAALWRMQRTYPRSWVVQEVVVLPPLKRPYRIAEVDERTREVLFPGHKARDFSQVAVIETDDPPQGLAARQGAGSPVEEGQAERAASQRWQARVVVDQPQRVRVEAELHQPGLLVLADAYYPGWRAYRQTPRGWEPTTTYRTNRVLRGVWLPAGRQVVEWRYEPDSFRRGVAVSLAGWLGVLGVAGGLVLRRWRRRPAGAARQIE